MSKIEVPEEGSRIGDNIQRNLAMLKDPSIGVVFLPHHGSFLENSRRWMKYLSDLLYPNKSIAWFISSSPEGKHSLPRRDIIEDFPFMNDSFENASHALSYWSEDGIFKNKLLFRFTQRPMYMTGTAPGGVYWLRVGEGAIKLYDAYPYSGGERGWKPLKQNSSDIEEEEED